MGPPTWPDQMAGTLVSAAGSAMLASVHRVLTPLAALLWGLQFSFLGPSLAMILTDLFGADSGRLGTVFTIYNAAGLVFSLLIPAAADRGRQYLRPLLGCAVLTLAMVATVLLVDSLWLATLGLVLLGAPASVGLSLLFAQMRHTGSTPEGVMRTRAFVSFAWIAGQPLATFVLSGGGARSVLYLIGGTALCNALVTIALMSQHQRLLASGATPPPVSDRAELPVTKWAMVTIVAAFVVLNTSNYATVTMTSLLVTEHMQLPVYWAGIALGISAGIEIPALLWLGRLSTRYSGMALMATGCLASVTYYALMAVVTQPWQLVLIAGLKSWGFATMSGVGLTLFQQVIARPGLASGLFNNTSKVGAIVAGPVMTTGALIAPHYSGVFWLSSGITVLALGLVLLVGTQIPRTPLATREPSPETAAAELGTDEAH